MGENDPNRPNLGDAGGNGWDPGHEPIPLEPSEPEPARTPPPPKPKIESPGLLDDFDEDADLESDPEVERIVKGIPVQPRAAPTPAAPPLSEFAQPTGDPLCPSRAWRAPVAIGAVATIAAVVFAGITATSVVWAHVLITLYWAALHTATGMGAVIAAGLLLGRPVGSFEGAGARIFLAVACFLAVFSLDIPLTGGKLEESLLGAAAYFGAVVVGFRLPPRDAAVVAGAHFGIALLVHLGSLLTAVISSAGAAT